MAVRFAADLCRSIDGEVLVRQAIAEMCQWHEPSHGILTDRRAKDWSKSTDAAGDSVQWR